MNKKQITIIGLLFYALIFSITASAQRIIDMEAILLSPTDGQEVRSGEDFDVVLMLKNNGPDNLIKGDTLFVNFGQKLYPVFLLGNIAANDSAVILMGKTKASNPRSSSIVQDLCIEIPDINSNSASSEGVPVRVTYDDFNPVNNLVCIEITVLSAKAPSSIEQAEEQKDHVRIFPNPANYDVTIQLGTAFKNELIVHITDISGRVLQEQKYTTAQVQAGRLSLNIAQLPAGVFIINLQSDTKMVSEKFTVIR